MPRSYPPEFRRKVLDLIAVGKTVSEVATDLGGSGQTIYNWRNQDRIDRGVKPFVYCDVVPVVSGSTGRGRTVSRL